MVMNQLYARGMEIVLQTIGVFVTKIQNSEEDHMEDRMGIKRDVGRKKKVVNITRIATDMEIVMDMEDVMDTDIAIIMLIGWV